MTFYIDSNTHLLQNILSSDRKEIYFFACPSSKSFASLIFAAMYGDPPVWRKWQVTNYSNVFFLIEI